MEKIKLSQKCSVELTDEGWKQAEHYLEKLVGDDPFGDEGITEGLRRLRLLTDYGFDENGDMHMYVNLTLRSFIEIFGEAIRKGIVADDVIYLEIAQE